MSQMNPSPDPKLSALGNRLARLQPAGTALDRDRMLFEAGRAAGASAQRLALWRASVALLMLGIVGFGTAWWSECGQRRHFQELAEAASGQSTTPRHHELDEPPTRLIVAHIDPNSYLALRQLISDGLSEPTRPPGPRQGNTNSPSGDLSTDPPRVRGGTPVLDL